MPRIAPITGKDDVPAEHHDVVDDVLSVFGRVRGPFSVLLHSPKLASKMLQLVKFNRGETIVEPPLRSIAILAAVREREAAYVWSAQVGAARQAGLREEVIDLLREKGDVGALPEEDERDIVTYVRQLARDNRVDYPVFNRLNERLIQMYESEDPSVTTQDTPLYRALAAAIARRDPDAVVAPILVPYGTDSNKFRPRGVKSYGIMPAIYTTEIAASMHGDAERFPAGEMGKAIRVLYEALRETAAAR